jgi:hypothetical protein
MLSIIGTWRWKIYFVENTPKSQANNWKFKIRGRVASLLEVGTDW